MAENGGKANVLSSHDARPAQARHSDPPASGSPSPSSSFPPAIKPPRYLLASREHEYDGDTDELGHPGAGVGADQPLLLPDESDVPVLSGLVHDARNRDRERHLRSSSVESVTAHAPNGHAREALPRRGSVSAASDASLDPDSGLSLGGGPGGTATLTSSIANMANSILGAGIVGLPYAVREAGFVTGILLLVVLGAVTSWTVKLMVVNAKLTGQKSYNDIMEHCFGRHGRTAVSFFQFTFAFGGMCAFGVILGDTLPHIFTSVFPIVADTAFGRLVFSRQVVIVICTLGFSYPLSLYRDIEKLGKASALALVGMAVIVLTVMVQGPALPAELRGDPARRFTIIQSGFFEAVGVIAFAYVCHHNTLIIFGSLKVPTMDNWNRIVHYSVALSVFASLTMAVAGYSVFIDRTTGNILNNFPSDNFWANIARFCFGLNMMTTTPLEAFVCREVIESYFFEERAFSTRRHFVVTTALVVGAMLVSLTTCDLGLVLELTGGFGATSLAFIFPAACSIRLSADPYARSRWPAWICVAFGITVCILATSLSLWKAGSKPHKVC